MNLWRKCLMILRGKNSPMTFNGQNRCLRSIKTMLIGKKFPKTETLYGRRLCWRNFKKQIDWKELSGISCETILTEECFEQFKDYWNWSELSDNENFSLTYELIDRFIDLWDWSNLIDRWSDSNLYTVDFLERYADKIPSSKLQDSSLWRKLVKERAMELKLEVIA